MRSPRTPIRLPRRRGSRRLRRAAESFASALIGGSFRGDGGFFGEHDRDVVAYGIDPAAGWRLAFEAGIVRSELDRSFAHGTNEDVEQFLRNSHGVLRRERDWNVAEGISLEQPR